MKHSVRSTGRNGMGVGIELVSPLPDVQSPIRDEMEKNGEGIKGVVLQ